MSHCCAQQRGRAVSQHTASHLLCVQKLARHLGKNRGSVASVVHYLGCKKGQLKRPSMHIEESITVSRSRDTLLAVRTSHSTTVKVCELSRRAPEWCPFLSLKAPLTYLLCPPSPLISEGCISGSQHITETVHSVEALWRFE